MFLPVNFCLFDTFHKEKCNKSQTREIKFLPIEQVISEKIYTFATKI